MKRSTLTLAFVLPALCAAVSSAQIMAIRAIAPINPIAGLPKLLPSPLTGPLGGMGIQLPSLVPSLTPSPALLAAAAPAAVLPLNNLPVALPSRAPRLPVPAAPSRENVINPLRQIMPGMTIRFSEKAPAEKTVPTVKKDELDQLFDGDDQPLKPGMNRGPIGNERRISLPEDDLMRELGF